MAKRYVPPREVWWRLLQGRICRATFACSSRLRLFPILGKAGMTQPVTGNYLTYREKLIQLVETEIQAQDLAGIYRKAISKTHIVCEENDFDAQTTTKINRQLKEVWPDIPEDLLIRSNEEEGPGLSAKLLHQYYSPTGYEGSHKGYALPEHTRPLLPSYAPLAKEVVQLRQKIEAEVYKSPEDLALLKLDLMEGPTMRDLYHEVTALIGEVEGMCDRSQVKREDLQQKAAGPRARTTPAPRARRAHQRCSTSPRPNTRFCISER